MLVEISASEFCDRVNSPELGDFSFSALEYLYDYYEQWEGYKLDAMAIHCDWSELALCDFVSDAATIDRIKGEINVYPVDLDDLDISSSEHGSYEGVLLPNGNVLFQYVAGNKRTHV